MLAYMSNRATILRLSEIGCNIIALHPDVLHWFYRNCRRAKGLEIGCTSIKLLDLRLTFCIRGILVKQQPIAREGLDKHSMYTAAFWNVKSKRFSEWSAKICLPTIRRNVDMI